MGTIYFSSSLKENNFNDLFYKEYATLSNELKFTPKELDVLACLINGKNVKSTAQLLEVAARTVESHIRNIMLKIGCNSREGIINCIEKSNQYHFFKHHYPKLQLRKLFNQNLQILKNTIAESQLFKISHIDINQSDQSNFPINQLIKDLQIVGIQTSVNTNLSANTQHQGYELWIGRPAISDQTIATTETHHINTSVNTHDKRLPDYLHIILKNNKVIITQFNFYDSSNNDLNIITQYFNLLMNILNKLFRIPAVRYCIEDFQQQCLKLTLLPHVIKHDKPIVITGHVVTEPSQSFFSRKIILILFIFATTGITVYLQNFSSCEYIPQHFSLKFQNSQLLKRPYLLQQIAMGLRKTSSIETVVISGLGGAGKTTLARQYAETQKHKVI